MYELSTTLQISPGSSHVKLLTIEFRSRYILQQEAHGLHRSPPPPPTKKKNFFYKKKNSSKKKKRFIFKHLKKKIIKKTPEIANCVKKISGESHARKGGGVCWCRESNSTGKRFTLLNVNLFFFIKEVTQLLISPKIVI